MTSRTKTFGKSTNFWKRVTHTTMVFPAPGIFLGILIVSLTASTLESVSPNLGAPDSNNLNMEFSPDDSVAGGVDTSLDNNNATSIIIKEPLFTTTGLPPTPTTTITTTVRPYITSNRLIIPDVINNVVPESTARTGLTTTTITSMESILSPVLQDPSISAAGNNPFNSNAGNILSFGPQINQFPQVQPQINQFPQVQPQINQFPQVQPQNSQLPQVQPQNNQFPQVQPQNNQFPQGNNPQGPLPRGRHNFPWWWLLMEEF